MVAYLTCDQAFFSGGKGKEDKENEKIYPRVITGKGKGLIAGYRSLEIRL